VEAQLLYPDAVGKLMSSTEMMKNPIAVEEYRNNSIQFLQDAAHGGSVEAMLMLSSAYYKGIIANQNILMAYAYRYAAINLSPAGTIDDPAVLYGANIPQNIIDNARRIGQRISSGSHN
jgi:TPR repeat protein